MTITSYFKEEYARGTMILLTLVTLLVSIRYYRRHKRLQIFTYYILFSLVQDCSDIYQHVFVGGNRQIVLATHGVITNLFMLMEFIVCTRFILQELHSRTRRRVVRVNALIFFAVVILFCCLNHMFIIRGAFFFFESLFLILPSLVYFYELFVSAHATSLKDQPGFWIITGILFLNCCSVPMYMVLGAAGRFSYTIFDFNYVLYDLFFCLLIRAYLCPPEDDREPVAA